MIKIRMIKNSKSSKLTLFFCVVMMVRQPLPAKAPVFQKTGAFAYLKKQCDFGPRVPGSSAHKKCLDFLTAELMRFTPEVVRQPFPAQDAFSKKSVSMTNVIASFSKSRKDRLLFCAHWDSRPVANLDPESANRNKPVPGANDGASGVAVLMELARILKNSPPPLGVDLVLFDGEDGGTEEKLSDWCLGSRYFASHWPKASYPRYAVLLDMVGGRDMSLPVEINSRRFAPDVVDIVWGTAQRLGLWTFLMTEGYEIVDDHLELIKVGIPAIDIVDLDYPYWHTTADTPDKCSQESLEAVGTLLLHLIYD
jgi:glutaminyl-peptide cyclotransferase